MGMTCNAEYGRNQNYATNVIVENFYGSNELTNAYSQGSWDSYGSLAPAEL